MNLLFVDLETIPTQSSDPIAKLRSDLQAADREREARILEEYKKPDTIQGKLAELSATAEARFEEAWRRTSLDGGAGEIVAIGYAHNREPARCLIRTPQQPESELIESFFKATRGLTITSFPQLVGWNVEWDLRFLQQRTWVHQLQPPMPLLAPTADVIDLMRIWSGRFARDFKSLDEVCLSLGIPSPKASGIDGSQVWDLVKAGRLAELADYCKGDVETARRVHHRLIYQPEPTIPAQEEDGIA